MLLAVVLSIAIGVSLGPPDEVIGLDSTRMDGLRDFVKSVRTSERADLVVAVTHTGLSVSRQIARDP